jgi:hypothetical protein
MRVASQHAARASCGVASARRKPTDSAVASRSMFEPEREDYLHRGLGVKLTGALAFSRVARIA